MQPLDSTSTVRRIGRYRLDGVLGRGGMGVVHEAFDEVQQRRVALKLLRPGNPDQSSGERFAKEMQIAVSLEHPNVVPVYETGEEDGVRYLAMRLVDGEDLGAVIRREGALDPGRVARLGRQIGSALDAAHAQGLVHRDVKPGNVLLTGHDDEEHAYLTDFGLTRDADDGLTQTGQWIGTVDYAAPEQIEAGTLSARTDVYAFGCVLYHALTGGLPFEGTFTAKAMAHSTQPLPSVRLPASQHGARIDAVLARATAKAPGERFATAGELARALAAAVTAPDDDPGQATAAMPAILPEEVAAADAAQAADEGATVVQPTAVTTPAPAARTPRVRDPLPAGTPRARRRAPAAPVAAAAAAAAGPAAVAAAAADAAAGAPSGLGPSWASGAPHTGGPARRGRLLALGAAALLVLALAVVLLSGGGGDGTKATSGDRTAAKASGKRTSSKASGSRTASGASTKAAPPAPVVAPATVAYTATKGAYTTRVPAGWSTSGEQDLGGVKRTIFTGPDGQTLLIDATPGMAPSFGREGRTVTGTTHFSTALGAVVGYRFTGQPAYCATGCVDYQLDLGGHGFAVQAGGTPEARAAARKAIGALQPTAAPAPAPAATSPAPAAQPQPQPAGKVPPGKAKKHGRKKDG
ncbi:serine/threonine protein kinase [Paraconexibacter antarcticus]|uniref:non-specific serine/threonine protein kinase n=1 Tax=Paraconexibacter antarcticus TaxID=2949664 RepID=A0ABY5DSH0_9ACTN|nr:serine/threonine-protein kinase [Paraconexibacter antarcticus]UTI64968.1 serine/threonine protein kinase [Paraconexibacter antarcticus]